MAKIKVFELSPAGSELFQGAENFLPELSDREAENIIGGSASAASVGAKTAVSNIPADNGGNNARNTRNTRNADFGAFINLGQLKLFG
jgi:hypothetical protein